MPNNNGFNGENDFIVNIPVNFEGITESLNDAEENINKGVKKINKNVKGINIGISDDAAKEFEKVRNEISELQEELKNLGKNKVSKSTFQKLKTELVARIEEIEKRVDGLNSALSVTIEELGKVGVNVDLSNIMKQFTQAKNLILETSNAVEKLSEQKGNSKIEVQVSTEEIEKYKQAMNELQQARKNFNKVINENADEMKNRLESKEPNELVKYFKDTLKEYKTVFEEYTKLVQIYKEAPEGDDLLPWANLNKAQLELGRIGTEAVNVKTVLENIIELTKEVKQDKEFITDFSSKTGSRITSHDSLTDISKLSDLIDFEKYKNEIDIISKSVKNVENYKASSKETYESLQKAVKALDNPAVATIQKEAKEVTEQIEKAYSTSLRLSELLSKGTIEIKVETDTTKLRKILDEQVSQLQTQLNKKSLVVPIKIVVGNEKPNSDNPLETTTTVLEKTRRDTKELVADTDKIAEKGLNRVLSVATTNIDNFVKDVKKQLSSIFDTAYPLKIELDKENFEKAQAKINDELISKGTVSINLDHANQAAKDLAKNIKEVLGLIETEQKSQLGLSTNYAKKQTKKEQKQELEDMMGKLEQYKEGAQKVLEYVQKSVFDKKPVYLNLKPSDASLNALQEDLKSVLNEDNDLTNSLLKAKNLAEDVVEILTPLNGLEIKLTGNGKKGSVENVEALKKEFDGLYTAMALIQKGNQNIEGLLTQASAKKTHNELQTVKTDFSEINQKIDELIETSKLLVQDLRNDISSIDQLFQNLETHLSNLLQNNALQTISDIDLTKLEKSLANIFELLIQILHKLDGISAKDNVLDKAITDDETKSQLKELSDIIDSVTTSLTSLNELQNVSKVFDAFNIKDSVLAKINQLPDDLKLISEKLRELDNMPTEGFIKELKEITAQADGLKSLAEILKNSSKQINEALDIASGGKEKKAALQEQLKIADQLEKRYEKIYQSGIAETQNPKEFANTLREVEELLRHIRTLSSGEIDDTTIATAKQIVLEVKNRLDLTERIKHSNSEMKSQLKEELQLVSSFKTGYKKAYGDGDNAEKYGQEYVDTLKQIDELLSRTEQYNKLKVVSNDDILAVKTLNEQLQELFKTLSSISTQNKQTSASLKDQLKTELLTAKKFESDYYHKWGYGAIPANYPNDYSIKLGEIKSKLEEIKTIEERFKGGIYTQEDVDRLKILNGELNEEYKALVQISKVAKDTKITNLQEKISKYMEKNTRLTTGMYNELGKLLNRLGEANLTAEDLNKIATSFNKIQYSARLAGVEGAGFLDAIKNKLKYGWAQSIAMFFSFYDIIRYVREISSAVTELNSNLIELAKVSDTGIGDLYNQFEDFANIAKETGGTVNDIIKSTADWARNGYNLPESKDLARLSSIFQNIGDGLTEAQANEYLVSTLKGFNLEASQAIEIMDKINNVSNNAASSVSNIGEALERSSSSFGAAKTDLSQAIALVTTSNEVLQNPETVGTAFKSLSARLRGATTELEEMGEEATITTSKLRGLVQSLTGVDIQKDENTFKSIYDILLEIGKEWKNLTDIEQASLSEALFGKRNSQVGFSILNNVKRLEEIYALAENSTGSAMEEQSKYLEGVQYRIDQFHASVEKLANDFMSSDFLKNAIKTGTDFVNILDAIIENLGSIPALVGAIGTAVGTKWNYLYGVFGGISNKRTIPLNANTDINAIALANSSQGIKALIEEYNNLGTTASKTGLTVDEFNAKLLEGGSFASTFFSTVEGGKVTFAQYQKALLATTIKTTALKVATAALQGLMMAGITLAINAVVNVIDELIVTTKEAIEAGEKARETISKINEELRETVNLVDESGKRFAELSQGINQLTGKNISLSTEDYQEFLNISNQLAKAFPNLSRIYDENGNAIVDLDGNVETITESLDNLLEEQRKLVNQSTVQAMDDAFKGASKEVESYDKEIRKIEKDIKHYSSSFDDITKSLNRFSHTVVVSSDYIEDARIFSDKLESLGLIEGKDFKERISSSGNIIYNFNEEILSDKMIEEISKTFSSKLSKLQSELTQKINEQNSKMSETMSSSIANWLFSNYSFSTMDEDLQSGIQQVINNLDWRSLDFSDWSQAENWIQLNILDVFKLGTDNAVTFTETLDLNTKFNNQDITAGEYEEKLSALMLIVKDLPEETQKAIRILFKIDDDGSSQISGMIENVRQQFQKAGLDRSIAEQLAKSLKKAELETIYNSNLNWADIIHTQNADVAIEQIRNKLRQLSSEKFKINLDRSDITNTTNGIKEIQSTFSTLYSNMEEGKTGVDLAFSYNDIANLQSKLVDLDGNVVDLGDTWDEFFNVMTDGSHSFEEMEESLNNVLTAYATATIDLENFDQEQQKSISTQLQIVGVTKESADNFVQIATQAAQIKQEVSDAGIDFAETTNNEIVALNQLKIGLDAATDASYDLDNITNDEISSLINEGAITPVVAQLLAQYAYQKQFANGFTITTSSDINNLMALAQQAGATTESLKKFAQAKARLSELEADLADAQAAGDTSLIRNIKRTIDTYTANLDTTVEYKPIKVDTSNLGLDIDRNKASKKSGGGGKEEDAWKKAYEEELAALDHLHEMELISDIDYYEERAKLNDKYFKDREKYTEEYNKNLEEIYKGFKSAYKQYVDEMSDYWKKSLDAGKISFKQYCQNMKQMLNDLHESGRIDDQTYYAELAEYYGNIKEVYDMVISAVQRRIKKEVDALNKQKDQLKKNYEARKKLIQDQIDSIQKEIDALEDANQKRKDALDLQKALYNLNRAENQRTKYVYNSEKGYIYEAADEDIKNAREELEDIRYQQKVSALEESITHLEEQIDLLDNELDTLTENLEKQIDALQEYSDKWGEVANKYREAQEDMYASAILGSEWQTEVINQNQTILENFTDIYVKNMESQANATVDAANKIVDQYHNMIDALNEWKRAQEEAAQTGYSTKTQDKTTIKNTAPSDTPKASNYIATSLSNRNSGKNVTSTSRRSGHQYGTGTDNAQIGWHEIAEGGDEIVLDNYGNAYLAHGRQLHKFEGGEKVYNQQETNELLKGKYIPIDTILPQYSDMLSKVMSNGIDTSVANLNKSLITKTNFRKANDTAKNIVITVGDINVTEVDNATQIAKAIKNKLPNALLQELNKK